MVPDFKASTPGHTVFKEGVRKHTWVVGWLPADDPKMVVAVYVHDTSTTSSHSSVYVMAQFLQRPEIQAYLHGEEE